MNITETMVIYGDAVKALDNGRVGGYLVRFTTESDPDISPMRDFFTADTDFDVESWDAAKSSVYYNHGLDSQLGKRKLANAAMKMDEVGVWVEAQLEMRDEYEKAIYDLAKAGKLGWSSGTASHLIERERIGESHRIKRWPLGLDASLTPIPAEPRNSAVSLKSLLEEETKSRTLEDHAKEVVDTILDFHQRLSGLKALRAEDGRDLSESAIAHLQDVTGALKNLTNELEALQTKPVQLADRHVVSRLIGEYYENIIRE